MSDLDLLIERWTVLSTDPAVPAETRRVLSICLQDLRETVAHLQSPPDMPNEHPSGEHDE